MSFITYKYKTVECPELNGKIQIKGEYVYLENDCRKARFLSASCPIVENLHLSKAKEILIMTSLFLVKMPIVIFLMIFQNLLKSNNSSLQYKIESLHLMKFQIQLFH